MLLLQVLIRKFKYKERLWAWPQIMKPTKSKRDKIMILVRSQIHHIETSSVPSLTSTSFNWLLSCDVNPSQLSLQHNFTCFFSFHFSLPTPFSTTFLHFSPTLSWEIPQGQKPLNGLSHLVLFHSRQKLVIVSYFTVNSLCRWFEHESCIDSRQKLFFLTANNMFPTLQILYTFMNLSSLTHSIPNNLSNQTNIKQTNKHEKKLNAYQLRFQQISL